MRSAARIETAAIMVALAASCAEAAAPAPRGTPRLVIRTASQDAGAVEQGTMVRYRFVVRNTGQVALHIRQVTPDTEWAMTRWTRVIPPGAAGTIEARLNTRSFRSAVTRHLTVESNDPQRPEQQLSISAQVTPLVRVEPLRPALLTVNDRPVSYEFRLERNGGKPMKIVKLIQDLPWVRAAVTPLPGAGRYRVKVMVSPAAPYGRTPVPILVKTDQTQAPDVQLLIMVDRGIVAVPPIVYYGTLPARGRVSARAAIVLMRQDRPFHIKNVTVNDPKLQPKLETVRAGSKYRITVSYAGGWAPGFQAKKLIVTTDDPQQPVLEIPVQGRVPAQVSEAPLGPAAGR